MNILKNKKTSLILKTIGGVAALSGSAALLFLPSAVQANNNQIKIDDFNNRSTNETSRDSLVNSEFYFETFTFDNPDQGADTLIQIPLAKAQWQRIKSNLEVFNRFAAVPAYQYILQTINNLIDWADSDNFIIRESLRASGQMDVWENIRDTLGFQEFEQVAGTQEELDKNIRILSGFVSGQSSNYRIRSLSNKSARKVNLETGLQTGINLPNEYRTVVTIAEIDYASLVDDIKIDFSYSSSLFTGIAARGSLIIRNKNNQIANNTLQENVDNLEIFGRWTNLGNNSVGTNNFRAFLDNFVLSKTDDGKLLVVARLRDGEQLDNIRVEGIDNFGIINSQIDNTEIYPTVDTASTIKFFSTNLLMTNATNADVNVPGSNVINTNIRKKYEFFVGDDTDFNLNLFYKNADLNVYRELFAFEGDQVSDTIRQTINVGVVGGNPTNIGLKNIEFSDEMIEEIAISDSSLSDLSMSLKTEKSQSGNFFKQSIYLNDLMALAISGAPIPSAGGITISLGNRITDKIFFEDPGFIDAIPPQAEVSSTNTIKWVNTENQVIAELARIYDLWSRGTGSVGSQKLGQKFYNKISYEVTDNKYQNITWRNESNDYTGREMYQNIVEEYAIYQEILAQLIPSISIENRRNIYEVGPTGGGTAQSIVRSTLLSINNKAQRTIIINNVKEILESNSSIKDLLIEQQLAELVRIKFSEMRTSLTDPINSFYYNEIKKYLDSDVSDKSIIVNPDSFMTFDYLEKGLFNLSSQNPKVLETKAQLTGSEKMKSLFDLLYFGSKSYGTSETTFFGSAIFGAISDNGGSESILDLFTELSNNQEILTNFSSSVAQTQVDSVNIYDRLLSVFGFGINSITENALITGAEIKLEWNGVNIEEAISTIFNKFNPTAVERVSILERDYEFNMLNSLITSANIYNSLTYRKYNTPEGIVSPADDVQKIVNILESGIISYTNIFTWSRIQKAGNDIDLYTTYFSRNVSETLRLSDEIKTKIDILDRYVEEQNALFQINPFLNVQIVWPILVGLIAVGMITVSSISLAGTRRTSKLSSKPVVKTILIIAILVSVVALGIIGALVVPGLL
ncbi:MAG: hypothetical protein ACRC1F_02245 [Metamycoplasmataceae bacterium]